MFDKFYNPTFFLHSEPQQKNIFTFNHHFFKTLSALSGNG